MTKISNNEDFKKVLGSLSLPQQRQVGARFAHNVMDLTDGSCTDITKRLSETAEITPEELEDAYHAVHRYYAKTHLLCSSEMDYGKQAAHFAAKACVACSGPSFGEGHANQLADLVAGYCRLARACSKITDDVEFPTLTDADSAFKEEMLAQHRILNEYLETT